MRESLRENIFEGENDLSFFKDSPVILIKGRLTCLSIEILPPQMTMLEHRHHDSHGVDSADSQSCQSHHRM